MEPVIEKIIQHVDNPTTLHLWEQCQNRTVGDCMILSYEMKYDHHHIDKPYDSWEAFLAESPHTCNCLIGNPIIYWFWRVKGIYVHGEDQPQNLEELIENEIDLDDGDYYEVKSDLLTLCYCPWSRPSIYKIEIHVTAEDEPSVRKFLKDQKSLLSVWQNL